MTARASHTPGPWTTQAAPHRQWVCTVGNNVDDPAVWTVATRGHDPILGDKSADARLIAAAPDLLAALCKAVELGQRYSVPAVYLDTWRAAIAKVERP